MFLTRPIPAFAFVRRARALTGGRALSVGLALLMELLLLLLLLTLGTARSPGVKESRTTLVSFRAEEVSQDDRTEQRAQTRRRTTREQPAPQPDRPAPPSQPPAVPTQPALVAPAAPPVTIVPMAFNLTPGLRRRPDRPAAAPYGPPAPPSSAPGDSERVGTAPNGEPLYAAQWYEEPRAEMLRSYLSTARGPGWGLIACRTAPDFRVEDCVPLDEYPQGSQINRSVLAAAWEFRVRPPRRGGESLVGAWVRIRIDYDLRRQP